MNSRWRIIIGGFLLVGAVGCMGEGLIDRLHYGTDAIVSQWVHAAMSGGFTVWGLFVLSKLMPER